jgi:hypothetical protein
VFVGHRIHNDIQTLRVLDFRFSRSLAYILDTDSVVKNVLGTWHGSLGALLQKMDSLFDKLHCAGSDANFTLRALLLLAAQGFIEQVPKQADKSNTVAILQQIASVPISHWERIRAGVLQKQGHIAKQTVARQKRETGRMRKLPLMSDIGKEWEQRRAERLAEKGAPLSDRELTEIACRVFFLWLENV